MKKIIFTTFFTAIVCFLFMGCDKNPDTLCPCGKVEINKKEYMAMCIVPEVVTANSVNKLRIENYTKHKMENIDRISLEYYNNNYWELIYLKPVNSAYMYLPAGDFSEVVFVAYSDGVSYNLYSLIKKYNDSKQGKYRIVNDVTSEEGKYKLVAEFEVK
jgi:hypothetical protein